MIFGSFYFYRVVYRGCLSYFKGMNVPDEFYQIIILVVVVGVAMALVGYLTKSGRNFRSSRNKKARKQN